MSRLILYVFLAFAAAGVTFRFLKSKDPLPPCPIEIDRAQLDFGQVWASQDFAWKLELRNRTRDSVNIRELRTSCNCVSVEPNTLLLPANGKAAVKLTLDLTRAEFPDTFAEGSFASSVVAEGDTGPITGASWRLVGRPRRLLYYDHNAFCFRAPEVVRGTIAATKSTNIRSAMPLSSVAANADPQFATVSLQPFDTSTFRLEVTPNCALPVGAYKFDVRVVASTESDVSLPPMQVPVEVIVVSDVQCLPPQVNWGLARVGEPLKEVISIKSRNGHQFRVVAVSAEGTLDVARIGPDDRYRLSIPSARPGNELQRVDFTVVQDDSTYVVSALTTYFGVGE